MGSPPRAVERARAVPWAVASELGALPVHGALVPFALVVVLLLLLFATPPDMAGFRLFSCRAAGMENFINSWGR